MHDDAFNVILFNSYCTVALQQFDCDSVTLIMFIHSFIHLPIYASCKTISGGRTEQFDIIAGFLPHHWLYE